MGQRIEAAHHHLQVGFHRRQPSLLGQPTKKLKLKPTEAEAEAAGGCEYFDIALTKR